MYDRRDGEAPLIVGSNGTWGREGQEAIGINGIEGHRPLRSFPSATCEKGFQVSEGVIEQLKDVRLLPKSRSLSRVSYLVMDVPFLPLLPERPHWHRKR